MTRAEQAELRELTQLIEKKLLKTILKKYGFKSISGIAYKVIGNWIYILFETVYLHGIKIKIQVKPISLDDLFWEIFEMKEAADSMPFSFHVNAAFVPWALTLENWDEPIANIDDAERVLDQVIHLSDEKIMSYCEQIKTIQDYKDRLLQEKYVDELNCMLCEIAVGDIQEAYDHAQKELAGGKTGGFQSVSGGSIYNYVIKYCEQRLVSD